MHRQPAQEVVKLRHSRPPALVGGHRQPRTFAKDLVREARQDIPRPDLDKDPRPGGIEGLDFSDKVHRPDYVLDQLAQDGSRISGIGRSCGVRVDGDPRFG